VNRRDGAGRTAVPGVHHRLLQGLAIKNPPKKNKKKNKKTSKNPLKMDFFVFFGFFKFFTSYENNRNFLFETDFL
jgi:hypothetical protein